jgi:hypothetical protein
VPAAKIQALHTLGIRDAWAFGVAVQNMELGACRGCQHIGGSAAVVCGDEDRVRVEQEAVFAHPEMLERLWVSLGGMVLWIDAGHLH